MPITVIKYIHTMSFFTPVKNCFFTLGDLGILTLKFQSQSYLMDIFHLFLNHFLPFNFLYRTAIGLDIYAEY